MSALPPTPYRLHELSLAKTHLDQIESLWLRRRAMLFDSRRTRSDLDKVAARFARAHAALSVTPRATLVRLCSERLTSPVEIERFGGSWLVASLGGDESWGFIDTAERRSFPWTDAMRHGRRAPMAVSLTHACSLDAASFHADVPTGVLLGALFSLEPPLRRAAILASGRRSVFPDFAGRETRRIALGGEGADRAIALYALGLAAPESWESFVLGALSDDILGVAHGAFLCGLFGGDALRLHLEHACQHSPTPATIRALGVLGFPASFPLLRSLLIHPGSAVQLAAAHGLFDAGGTAGSVPEALSIDVRQVLDGGGRDPIPEASAGLVRHHRGRPLLGNEVPEYLTHHWLRSLVTRASSTLRFELPDGMFGEGYHQRSYGPHNLGATA